MRRIARGRHTGLFLVLAAVGATIGIGPSPAGAAVFTDLSLPTITGTAVEGQTLTEVHARWSTPPASYAYQWARCDSSGNHCQSISKATTQTYRLTAADVGFTIRVGESARDAEGAVTPSESEPTAVVKAQASNEQQGGSGGGGNPPASCCKASKPTSQAQIKTLLARQLAPSGKAASISKLLEHGGLHMSFTLPEAGTLVVQWYVLPPGAKLAGKKASKPILVASGRATFTKAETIGVTIRLTAQGKKLLRHASKLHLEAKGTFAPKGSAAVSVMRPFVLKR
jgi:hypothetical protein